MVLPEIRVITVKVITLVLHAVGKRRHENMKTENALLAALSI